MQRRELIHRLTWEYEIVEPITGNYLSVNHEMYLQDQRSIFQVLNDHSQRGTILHNSTAKLVIDRRMYSLVFNMNII